MIKVLINDLAFDNISLNQALTRAKLIASKIKNDVFKNWISSELNGYTSKNNIPLYRVLKVKTVGSIRDTYNRESIIPIELSVDVEKIIGKAFYEFPLTESIPSLERILSKVEGNYIYLSLDPQFTQKIIPLIKLTVGYRINYLSKEIGISMLFDIHNKTKQKLLDTLLELNEQFPNLENDFTTMDDKTKANQIITTNIYGNISNANVGIGDNINQNINQNQLIEVIKQLKELGLPNAEIVDLEEIIKSKDSHNETLSSRLLQWVTTLGGKAVDAGIKYEIPKILEALQPLLS